MKSKVERVFEFVLRLDALETKLLHDGLCLVLKAYDADLPLKLSQVQCDVFNQVRSEINMLAVLPQEGESNVERSGQG